MHDRALKRLAHQIVLQLPESEADTAKVLRYIRKILDVSLDDQEPEASDDADHRRGEVVAYEGVKRRLSLVSGASRE